MGRQTKLESNEDTRHQSEKLVEGEARFQNLFENSPQTIGIYEVVHDEDSVIVDLVLEDANQSFEWQLEMPLESLKGKSLAGPFGKETLARIIAQSSKIMSSGKAYQFDQFVPWVGRHYMWSCFPLAENRMAIIGSDITNFKRTEEALKESEEKFAKAFHGTVAAMAIVRFRDGMFIEVNERWLELHGMIREEVIGHTSFELNVWVDLKDREEFIKELDEKGFFQDNEFRFRSKNGQVWIALMFAQVIELRGEKVIISSLFDVTDRKKAEEELKENEKKFRGLTDASPAGVIVYQDGRILYVNPAAATISGYTKEELLDMSFLDLLHPEYKDIAWKKAEERMSGMEEPARYEVKIITKDGYEKWLDLSSGLIAFSGSCAGIVVCTDLTEHKRGEEILGRYSEELERSNADLQEFVYVASHDLQEPLRMITSYIALFNKKYGEELDARGKEYLHFAYDGAERMMELIDDLLEYSRVKTRGQSFKNIDLNRIMKKVESNLHIPIIETKAEIACEWLPIIRGDEKQITMVMQNLVSNAIKFHTQEPPIVQIASREDHGEWIVRVKDNGIGIDPGQIDKLFHMFQRLHTREEYEGTGIGLAITKKIVERHGGRIWVESEGEGKGTTFYFTIPKIKPGE